MAGFILIAKMEENFCRLFVGGKLFVVSDATLRRYENSNFAKLLDESFQKHKKKKDIIYIDRDGKHFGSIMNHLRDCLDICGWNEKELRELLAEADFYCLDALKEVIEAKV